MTSVMSVSLKKVTDWARSYSSKLRATDKRFNKRVFLKHQDGSTFLWDGAFFLKKKFKGIRETWLLVFTEHHGEFAYDVEDVRLVLYYPPRGSRETPEDDGLNVPNAVMKR